MNCPFIYFKLEDSVVHDLVYYVCLQKNGQMCAQIAIATGMNKKVCMDIFPSVNILT